MKNVMKMAWEIAREGQKNFGGNVKEYIAESLRIVWSMVSREKSTAIKCNWTTPNGATVEMHVERRNEKVIGYNEGLQQNITRKEDHMEITKLTLNGESLDVSIARRDSVNGVKIIRLDSVRFMGKFHRELCIGLPAEIEKKAWGEYDARVKAREEARANYDRKQDKMNAHLALQA